MLKPWAKCLALAIGQKIVLPERKIGENKSKIDWSLPAGSPKRLQSLLIQTGTKHSNIMISSEWSANLKSCSYLILFQSYSHLYKYLNSDIHKLL